MANLRNLRVVVPLLNIRKFPVENIEDKSNVVGKVKKNFQFESIAEVTNDLGNWYQDRDGYYYWGGGVEVIPLIEIDTEINFLNKKDWGFIDFKIGDLWKNTKGKGIKVAVIDKGLNDIEDFKYKTNISYYNAANDSEDKKDCLDDSNGHGTNCVGILCGQGKVLYGVAPEIDLFVIKTCNDEGITTSKEILRGIEKAIEMNSEVISLSFSIAKRDNYFNSIYLKIKEAYQKDIIVLAAAGDSGELNFPVDNFPASFPECLSIGGINRMRRRSKSSTKSNFLDLMGPGEDLISNFNPKSLIMGTSFATPFLAGVIALLKSFAKDKGIIMNNNEFFDILKRTADIKVNGNYNLLEYGWGIVDPVAALNLLIQK